MGVRQDRAPWRSCGSRPSRFRRKLDREIARLLAAQDAIDIGGGTAKDVYRAGSVGEQTAVSSKGRKVRDRGYVVTGRRRYNRRAMCDVEWTRRDDKAA